MKKTNIVAVKVYSDCEKCRFYKEDTQIKGFVNCGKYLLPSENCLKRKINCCKYERV